MSPTAATDTPTESSSQKPHSRKGSLDNSSMDKGSSKASATAKTRRQSLKDTPGTQAPGKVAKEGITTSTEPKAGTGPDGGEKLSNAEIKKRKQAEKQARRAQAKAQGPQQDQKPSEKHGQSGDAAKKTTGAPAGGMGAKGQHKRTASLSKGLPIRPAQGADKASSSQPKKDIKKVALFGHLYGHPRRHTITGAHKDVHPAVLALGLQMSSYSICGSSARCVATLIAFKAVIESYTTPPHHSLPRHLTTHLSTQIDYLVSCRPLPTSTGNAIRWLKLEISAVDPSQDETVAKTDLCDSIDRFIQERITFADHAIASTAITKIQDGDTILTYGKSHIVIETLLMAHREGKNFSVVVVDSRPLFEGRHTAKALADAGLDVEYTLTHGLAHVIIDASKVFLGAHSMLGNGRLYARAGSALVAMMAKKADIPVIVCCESVKFTDKVALDSIVTNEVAPPEELVFPSEKGKKSALDEWRDKEGLQMLNLMYDVTPAEYVAMIVTEYGCLPPSSVPVVHRLSTNT